MSVLDKPRLATHTLGKGVRRIRRFFGGASTSLTSLSSLIPERISKAPPDLRTKDPQLAIEYYNGRYVFGGKHVETGGKSPFLHPSQGDAWERELQSFEWLRHLSASEDTINENFSRALISDWIELYKNPSNVIAWDIEVTSRRLIAWLSNSILIINNADHQFHELLMRIIGNHIRYLKRELTTAKDGMPKFYANVALGYASICHENSSNPLSGAIEQLVGEVDVQIFADGGHITRNPAHLVDILLLLLPLKQACNDSEIEPPTKLQVLIDRIFQALRFFKLGDGSLGRFNGSGYIENDFIATLMRHDKSGEQAIEEAPDSGYQRLDQNKTVLLMDTGPAPRGELSVKSHAGCLSFEFSHGTNLLICNSGAPRFPENLQNADWRFSQAHSTVTLNDTSSCKFETTGTEKNPYGGQIYSAPLNPEAAREVDEDFAAISAAHNGYVRDFGVRHQRDLILDMDGERLSGNDWFTDANKGDLRADTKDAACFRFHLAPAVKASVTKDGQSVLLQTRDGDQWIFSCPGFKVELEQSTYFAGIANPLTNWQIVIRVRVATTPEIKWVLQKLLVD